MVRSSLTKPSRGSGLLVLQWWYLLGSVQPYLVLAPSVAML